LASILLHILLARARAVYMLSVCYLSRFFLVRGRAVAVVVGM
jgi:hypothetical protein